MIKILIILFIIVSVILQIMTYYLIPKLLFLGSTMNTNNAAYRPLHSEIIQINKVNLDTYTVGNGPILIIYFHGNAGSIGSIWKMVADEMHNKFNDITCVVYDYRGFGFSEGEPTMQNSYDDALQLTEYMIKRHNPEKLILYGRSLGGAVCLHVGAFLDHRVHHIVLETPFFGLWAVKLNMFMRWFLNMVPEITNSESLLATCANVGIPIRTLLAEKDNIIDFNKALSFFQNTVVEVFPGLGHNDISADPRWKEVMYQVM
jgi:fermentation-respiration switch protein FrsA (DUF1100 family)